MDDPMEHLMMDALNSAGVKYFRDGENPAHLDFYLPDFDVHIQVKQFHSERISEQMSRVQNVIVAQGRDAVELLAMMVAAKCKH